VDNVLDEYISQISLLKICSIHFSVEDIKISINSQVSDQTIEPFRVAGASAKKRCTKRAERGGDLHNNFRDVTINGALPHRCVGCAVILIDVPQSFFGMSNAFDALYYFLIGVMFNGARFLLLGIVIGYLYNERTHFPI
jgi:hypothetical protein